MATKQQIFDAMLAYNVAGNKETAAVLARALESGQYDAEESTPAPVEPVPLEDNSTAARLARGYATMRATGGNPLLAIPEVAAVAEPAMQLATGTVAHGIGGAAGIAALGYDLTDKAAQKLGFKGNDIQVDPEQVRQYVMDKVQYKPVTEAGQSATNIFTYPGRAIGAVGNALSGATRLVTDPLRERFGDIPYVDTALTSTEEVVPIVAGIYAGSKLPVVADAGSKLIDKIVNRSSNVAGSVVSKAFGSDPRAMVALKQAADAQRPTVMQGPLPSNFDPWTQTAPTVVTPSTALPTTASQAAGPNQSVNFAGLEQVLRQVPEYADEFAKIRAAQEQVLIEKPLSKIAGGATEEASLSTQAKIRENVAAKLNPRMDSVIGSVRDANTQAAAIKSQLDAAIADMADMRVQGYNTNHLLMRQGRANIAALKNQLDNFNIDGVKPLRAESVTKSIDKMLETPSVQGSVKAESALRAIKARILEKADDTGYIDPETLRGIRQTGVNEAIDSAFNGDPTASKTSVRRAVTPVRGLIDSAVDSASGNSNWSSYNRQWAKMERALEKMDFAKALKAGTRSNLEKVGTGGNIAKVEKAFGQPVSGINEAMGKRAPVIRRAGEYLTNERMLSDIANPSGAIDIIKQNAVEPHIAPNLLIRQISLMNKANEIAARRVNAAAMDKASQAMLSPQGVIDLIYRKPYEIPGGDLLNSPVVPLMTGQNAGMMTREN